ncbi:hypothetical protein CPC08DRAFT_820108 [Agrocybe pediades]|nr:hypothetical protein CPC08DRAFT_820108 [Agrocybe pediades]
MAIIRNNKISTNFKYVRIGSNEDLSLPAIEHEYSVGTKATIESESAISSRPSETQEERNEKRKRKEERRKIRRSEGCFITKQPGFSLENAHWVNAVRKDASRKKQVEGFLIQAGVAKLKFQLDDVSNLAPLDRSLHYTLDKLGFLAVTCARETLESLIALVDKENMVWQNKEGGYRRFFNFQERPFTDAMYELVLLHPHHFLPKKGNALTVFTEHGSNLSGKMYVVSPDGALREDSDNIKPRIPAFSSNRTREEKDMLNPFLVVINAEIAFRRLREEVLSTLCEDYKILIALTIELAAKIYFRPLVAKQQGRQQTKRRAISTDISHDVDMDELRAADELGMSTAKDNDKTITQRGVSKKFRMQATVNGAEYDESYDIEDYNEDRLPSLDIQAYSPGQVNTLEKVQQWRVAVQ